MKAFIFLLASAAFSSESDSEWVFVESDPQHQLGKKPESSASCRKQEDHSGSTLAPCEGKSTAERIHRFQPGHDSQERKGAEISTQAHVTEKNASDNDSTEAVYKEPLRSQRRRGRGNRNGNLRKKIGTRGDNVKNMDSKVWCSAEK